MRGSRSIESEEVESDDPNGVRPIVLSKGGEAWDSLSEIAIIENKCVEDNFNCQSL